MVSLNISINFLIILENHLQQNTIKNIVLQEISHHLIVSRTDFDGSFDR